MGFEVPAGITTGRRSISQEQGQLSGQLKRAAAPPGVVPGAQLQGPSGRTAAVPVRPAPAAAAAPIDIFSTSAPMRSSLLSAPMLNEIEPAEEVRLRRRI